MSRPDACDSSVALEYTVRESVALAETLGVFSAEQIHAIAQAIGDAYIRGVTDGGKIALNAIDDALGTSQRVTVN